VPAGCEALVRSGRGGLFEKPPHLSYEPSGLLAELSHVSLLENDELLVVAAVAILEDAVVDAAP
jgi:hypothetical protein